MKALSILQPWASLVVHGHKRIETRGRPTRYRGPLAIHAGRRFRAAQRQRCYQPPFAAGLAAARLGRPVELPRGGVIGLVSLVDCVPAGELVAGLDGTERHLGDYGCGQYAWVLADPVAFAVPIPCVGRLGLFELPEEVDRALREQAGGAA